MFVDFREKKEERVRWGEKERSERETLFGCPPYMP